MDTTKLHTLLRMLDMETFDRDDLYGQITILEEMIDEIHVLISEQEDKLNTPERDYES